MIKYIDTHAHLNLSQFDTDLAAVVERCGEKEVGVINIGTHHQTSVLAKELAEQYDHMWSMVGLHPNNIMSRDPDEAKSVAERKFDYSYYKTLAESERVVGIGECGFDYMYNSDSAESYKAQRDVFEAQIELANELDKPLMLHLRNGKEASGRDAYNDALAILRSSAKVVGNAHFWAGSVEQMRQFFDLGYTVSFTGVITFASGYKELVDYAPLDLIHAETDCPYVAPNAYRGQRCEPWMMIDVVERIAKIKKLDVEVVREQLFTNAARLYGVS